MKKADAKSMFAVPKDLVAEFDAFSKGLVLPGVEIQVSKTQVMVAALKLGLERMKELQRERRGS